MPPSTFPLNSTLIDNFNRANGALEAGGGSTIWSTTEVAGAASAGIVASNQAKVDAGGHGALALTTMGPNMDLYWTVSTLTATTLSSAYHAFFWNITDEGTATFDSQALLVFGDSTYSFRRFLNGSGTTWRSGSLPATLAVGDKIGVRQWGNQVELWFNDASAGGTWANVDSQTDTFAPVSDGGPIAFEFQDTTVGIDDLSGGSITGPPFVVTSAESATTTAGTSHTVTLPSGIVAGDLLLVCLAKGSTAATVNALAGWTELLDENNAAGLYIAYRWADGTEGASISLTTSASTRDASVSFRIAAAENPAVSAPQIGTTATGTSTTPDPPSLSPAGGAKDYLWIVVSSSSGEQADDDTYVTTFPTNYTSNQLEKACGTAGTNLGGLIGAATRIANTATENPGTFTVSENDVWRAQTIAVPPVVPPNPAPDIVIATPIWNTSRG